MAAPCIIIITIVAPQAHGLPVGAGCGLCTPLDDRDVHGKLVNRICATRNIGQHLKAVVHHAVMHAIAWAEMLCRPGGIRLQVSHVWPRYRGSDVLPGCTIAVNAKGVWESWAFCSWRARPPMMSCRLGDCC